MDNDKVLPAILIVMFAIIGIGVAGYNGYFDPLLNGARAVANRYDIEGKVVGSPDSKIRGSSTAAVTEKFAIRVSTDDGTKIVNCSSTQCSELQDGDLVLLNCFRQAHWTQPDEEECRFDKLLDSTNTAVPADR